MPTKIRHNVYETNSSSTHTLNITTDKKGFEEWANGIRYLVGDDTRDIKFLTKIEVIDYIRKHKWYVKSDYEPTTRMEDMDDEEFDEVISDFEIYSFKKYEEELEAFDKEITTEHGDTVIVFGRYGYM